MPAESCVCEPFGMSMSRLVTMLTTAPARWPPNSAGNAPVKISSESMLRGSISSREVRTRRQRHRRAVDLVGDAVKAVRDRFVVRELHDARGRFRSAG